MKHIGKRPLGSMACALCAAASMLLPALVLAAKPREAPGAEDSPEKGLPAIRHLRSRGSPSIIPKWPGALRGRIARGIDLAKSQIIEKLQQGSIANMRLPRWLVDLGYRQVARRDVTETLELKTYDALCALHSRPEQPPPGTDYEKPWTFANRKEYWVWETSTALGALQRHLPEAEAMRINKGVIAEAKAACEVISAALAPFAPTLPALGR